MVHPFCQYARTQIKGVLAARGESLRWLSKQTKVEYHRIYRIDAGEMKALSYFDAKKLLTFMEPDTAEETLKRFYPAETQHVPHASTVDGNELQDRLLQFALQSQIRWSLFLHIATGSGTNRAAMKETFGTLGLEVLQELIDGGVISENDDGILLSCVAPERTPSEETLMAEARMQIGLLNFDHSGTYLRNEQHRYNAAGRLAVYDIFQELKDKLRSIDSNPAYAGDQLYVYTLALGSLRGGVNHEE